MTQKATCKGLQLILASGSRYKKDTLNKLGIPFSTMIPNIDESALKNESAESLVQRLSLEKAQCALNQLSDLSNYHSDNWFIIGVDQVALFDGKILGKPHTRDNAIKQLTEFSNNNVKFLTGISLLSETRSARTTFDTYQVSFKPLSEKQITAYIDAEKPLDCAGSFKCEGMGVLLFSSMSGRDINSLIGMPLMSLQELFLSFNIDIFDYIMPDRSSS